MSLGLLKELIVMWSVRFQGLVVGMRTLPRNACEEAMPSVLRPPHEGAP